jgi:hypothetical protein
MGVNPNAPDWGMPFLDANGNLTQAWHGFLVQLGGYSPGPVVVVPPTASPMTYIASAHGNLAISGGTVSSIELTRAHVTGVNLGFVNGSVPLSQGDQVTITYSAAPTINFIPS